MKTSTLNKNPYLKAFFLGVLTAFCIFLPFLIVDQGFFTYAGDFNSQQIPFYMYANQMVHKGALNWSWATDLGTSFVNGYSFYLLGSPFFWLSCLFPYKAVPYILPFLLMLKFGFASLGAFGYLRRYAKNDNYAFIGGVLYAFSGFAVYNIFFNHFLESVAFFPFLLWALDEFVYEKRKGVFPLIVALNLINNYFFFIGQVVFLFLYFFFKVYTKEYRISLKEFLHLAFESIVGCFMGIVLFIPSLFVLFQNPRVGKTATDFGLWMYYSVQQYFAIAASAFLPPDAPYLPSLFTEGNIKWTSLSIFVALGGLFGFFVFAKYNKRSSFFKLFSACIICAFVPVFNSAFYAFNVSYYARWFYMPCLILVAMNMQSFCFEKHKIFYGIKITAILTAIFLVFGITPTQKDGKWAVGIAAQTSTYWLNILIACLSLYLLFLLVYKWHGHPRYGEKLMSGALSIIMLFSIVHLSLTKLPQWNADKLYKPQNYDVLNHFDLQDDAKDFRIDTYQCYDNLGLFTTVPCIQFFNSTVTPSIMEFYPSVGVKRDVSSKAEHSMYALRSLLSVKYLITPKWEVSNIASEGNLLGYKEYKTLEPYTVFINDNFIPMGFAYDRYVPYNLLDSISKANRSAILLRAIALEEDLIAQYNLDLPQLDGDLLFDYTYETTLEDVANRKRMASYEFVQNDDGFVCKIKLEKANLVFFSVPYDSGFSATVNGQPAQIHKVSYGMSAVYAPAGDNEIIFTYRTPGLTLGILFSCLGLLVYISYLFWLKKQKNK